MTRLKEIRSRLEESRKDGLPDYCAVNGDDILSLLEAVEVAVEALTEDAESHGWGDFGVGKDALKKIEEILK